MIIPETMENATMAQITPRPWQKSISKPEVYFYGVKK